MSDMFIAKRATISECGQYRYRLWRVWDEKKPVQIWIMLNPSTADAEVDDPTIKRITKRAQAGDFGGITVVNLFAFRATNPSIMMAADDPIGPHNFKAIQLIPEIINSPKGGQIVCGWGERRKSCSQVALVTSYLVGDMGLDLYCLDTTKGGHPVHPLYQPYKKQPRLWLNQGIKSAMEKTK